MTETITRQGVGPLLRDWRRRRHLSQMDLALEAGVSTRHLSFVETGRSRPSAEMVVTLAEVLDVPLRDRNQLLLAAGHAPVYGQRDLDEPEMGPVRQAIDTVLAGHEPYPAVVLDRHWGMVAANTAVGILTEGVAPHLLEPPVNVLRASLHPEGCAPRIVNLAEWRAHLLDRVGPPGGGHRRPRAGGPARGGGGLPRRRPQPRRPTWTRARSRCPCASATATPSWRSSAP